MVYVGNGFGGTRTDNKQLFFQNTATLNVAIFECYNGICMNG